MMSLLNLRGDVARKSVTIKVEREQIMSLIYSILKPVLKKMTVKKSAMTREDFIRQADKD